MSNIRVMRFITGEIVIAKIQQKEGNYILQNPIQIHLGPPQKPNDPPTIALAPWAPFIDQVATKNGLTINKDHVTYEGPAIKQLESAYAEQTTGLVRPTNSGGLLVPPGV